VKFLIIEFIVCIKKLYTVRQAIINRVVTAKRDFETMMGKNPSEGVLFPNHLLKITKTIYDPFN